MNTLEKIQRQGELLYACGRAERWDNSLDEEFIRKMLDIAKTEIKLRNALERAEK